MSDFWCDFHWKGLCSAIAESDAVHLWVDSPGSVKRECGRRRKHLGTAAGILHASIASAERSWRGKRQPTIAIMTPSQTKAVTQLPCSVPPLWKRSRQVVHSTPNSNGSCCILESVPHPCKNRDRLFSVMGPSWQAKQGPILQRYHSRGRSRQRCTCRSSAYQKRPIPRLRLSVFGEIWPRWQWECCLAQYA